MKTWFRSSWVLLVATLASLTAMLVRISRSVEPDVAAHPTGARRRATFGSEARDRFGPATPDDPRIRAVRKAKTDGHQRHPAQAGASITFWAKVQELREALDDFSGGKVVHAWLGTRGVILPRFGGRSVYCAVGTRWT